MDELIEQLQHAESFEEFELGDIIAVLMKADDLYENGDEPFFTDDQYDAIKKFAQQVDPKNDYFQHVGSDVRGGKVVLPNAMGSLTQAYNESDLEAWKLRHGIKSNEIFIAGEKEDGMSSSLHYNNKGEFRIAYSRGNGTEGADMSRHVKHFKNLPKKVTKNLEVRAEIIISNKNFEFLKTRVFRSDGSPYKNPRNMISGLMNASSVDPLVYSYIDVIAYHDWSEPIEDKDEQLERFRDLGFKVPTYYRLSAAQLTDEHLTKILNSIRDNSEYLVDGIVLEVNDATKRQKMNPSKATLNPEYARKYKVADAANNAVATVDFVELRVSKRGYVIPRVHFIPFPLNGVTVTHATGFNMKFIIDNGICPGAKLNMTRSGDVIPYITGVAQRGDWTLDDWKEELEEFGEWKWTKNDKGEEVHIYLTGDHANIGIKLAEGFFTGIGVDGLKLGNLKKLFECGYDSPEKIIKASVEEMGFALASDSTASKIHASLHKALKSVTLPVFMGSTGLFGRGVGKRKIQKLYDVLGDKVLEAAYKDLYMIEGFSDKTIAKYMNGLGNYKMFFEAVKDYVEFVKPKVVEGGKLNGQKVLFTGHRSKALAERIENEGGVMADSFSSSVTLVIAADPEEQTGKVQKARAKGIRIIGLADVEDLFE